MTVFNDRTSDCVRTSCIVAAVIVALATLATALSACSTTEGFGKDVKNLGGNIEDSADRNK